MSRLNSRPPSIKDGLSRTKQKTPTKIIRSKPMKKLSILTLTVIALGGLASTAYASGVHFTKAGVTFTADPNVLTLTASGAIAGLGNGALVTIAPTADPTTTCTNQGGNPA